MPTNTSTFISNYNNTLFWPEFLTRKLKFTFQRIYFGFLFEILKKHIYLYSKPTTIHTKTAYNKNHYET